LLVSKIADDAIASTKLEDHYLYRTFPTSICSLGTIFLPLDLNVWLLHIAMMVAGAAILLFIEATGDYVRRSGSESRCDPGYDTAHPPNLSLNGLIKGVWAAFTHFLWNGPKHDPRTAMGKLALFALSFHTLVIAASYTASLAGFLATSSTLPVEVHINYLFRPCAFDLVLSPSFRFLSTQYCRFQKIPASCFTYQPLSLARTASRSIPSFPFSPPLPLSLPPSLPYSLALPATLSLAGGLLQERKGCDLSQLGRQALRAAVRPGTRARPSRAYACSGYHSCYCTARSSITLSHRLKDLSVKSRSQLSSRR
jgi:hypothetical protein